jgi:predicted Zn-dependent protease with MMP-like domain
VALRVEEFATDEMLDELNIDDPFELTGLYDGVPLTEKSVMDQPNAARCDLAVPPRDPRRMGRRGDVALFDLVAHVYVHELAHHFGWSDEEIAAIDRWWE